MNIDLATHKVTAIILAGGQGRRLGGRDKGLVEWRQQSLVQHVISRIEDQVDQIIISCNQNRDQYRALGYEICQDNDQFEDAVFEGPVAGIVSARHLIQHPFTLVCACDTPKLPQNLATTLLTALLLDNSDISFPACDGQLHYLPALIKTASFESIDTYFKNHGRSLKGWYAKQHSLEVPFLDALSFSNFNHPEDFLDN